MRALADETKPDLVVNFFEPLTGLVQLFRPLPIPVIAVAHQFMIRHPAYLPDAQRNPKVLGFKLFADLVGCRSWKLALSLYPAADLPERRLVVSPPLLRRALFEREATVGDYVLIYLLNHGYAEEIRTWHRVHSDVVLHVFYDRPGAPDEEVGQPNLTFHRLDGEKFLRMMAGCRAVVCTAGFESLAEAAWLGKPLFLVPVENHIEQQLNALDAVRLGLGITDRTFALDRLGELPARLDNDAYRAWIATAEEVLARVVQQATGGSARPSRSTAGRPRPDGEAVPAEPSPNAAP